MLSRNILPTEYCVCELLKLKWVGNRSLTTQSGFRRQTNSAYYAVQVPWVIVSMTSNKYCENIYNFSGLDSRSPLFLSRLLVTICTHCLDERAPNVRTHAFWSGSLMCGRVSIGKIPCITNIIAISCIFVAIWWPFLLWLAQTTHFPDGGTTYVIYGKDMRDYIK